jgi:hypothetical protein
MKRDIGKAVWQSWGGTLRWGIIKSSLRKDKWKYYNIDWINDDVFKGSQEYRKELMGESGKDYQIYQPVRCDHVKVADLESISASVKKLQKKTRQ